MLGPLLTGMELVMGAIRGGRCSFFFFNGGGGGIGLEWRVLHLLLTMHQYFLLLFCYD